MHVVENNPSQKYDSVYHVAVSISINQIIDQGMHIKIDLKGEYAVRPTRKIAFVIYTIFLPK